MHGGDIYRNKIDMDFSVNINPCKIPTSVEAAMFQALKNMTSYPDIECEELRRALGKKHSVNLESIVCGNGASELILAIINGIRPKKILVTAPGFLGYENAAKAVNSKVVYHYLDKEKLFIPDIEQIISDIEKNKPQLVFITNPNNPNGSIIYKDEMKKIALACQRNDAILVIDECFCELSRVSKPISFIEESKSFDNVLVLRAFTKTFAIPGARLGYLICNNNEILEKIKLNLSEWNVSVLANAAGLAALKEDKYIEASRELIFEERVYLMEELEKLNIHYYPSKTNYVLLETNRDLYEELLKVGILIRDCSDYEGLTKGFYRIAVKTHKENEKLIAAIKGEYTKEEQVKIEYVLPGDIEARSFEMIGDELLARGIVIPEQEVPVTKRVIHTSADFEYANTMCYSKNAIEIARELIKNGADIVTDTNMAKAGINKTTLAKFGGEVHCFMADEDVAKEAKQRQVTRATVSMERAAKIDKPVIFAIGNAPTALIALKELMDRTGFKPAFIIGVPVGFVNVEAAKELIMQTDVPYIVNQGRKGGSNVAAAICNALMYGLVQRD